MAKSISQVQIKGWKVTGIKGAGDDKRKADLSRLFTVRSAAEKFRDMCAKEHPEAVIECVYTYE